MQLGGFDGEICCNFQVVNSPVKLVEHFGNVDVCIGIGVHGAGLSNCVLAKQGSVLVELQQSHAFGFDSFMKVAHMTAGSYVFMDIRSFPVHRGKGAGTVLSVQSVTDMVRLVS
eukprot:gene13378-28363_t